MPENLSTSRWTRSLFLIGAQKAGSTYLHNLLCMAVPHLREGRVKELHVFSSSRREVGDLADLFPDASADDILIDSSTSYLHNPDCAPRIAAAAGSDVPIITTVRDPVKRLVSAYLHARKHGTETRSLREVLDLSGDEYASIRAEELARAKAAYREGRIVLRHPRPWPREFREETYDTPLWNFLYVSNSFYYAQSAPFRERFENFSFIDMAELIRDPATVLAMLEPRLGLSLPYIEKLDDVDRNTTQYIPHRALHKFVCNHQAAGTFSPQYASRLAKGGLFLLSGDGKASITPEAMTNLPWYAPLMSDFVRVLEK